MKRLVLIPLLLVACIPMITQPDVLYIGDSLCVIVMGRGPTAQALTGVKTDCKSGRRLVNYNTAIPPNKVVFMALGTNDALDNSPESYRSKLVYVLNSTTAHVWCALPPTYFKDRDTTDIRNVILDECPNTIDMDIYGVYDGGDGIHWDAESHRRWANAIRYVLQVEGLL